MVDKVLHEMEYRRGFIRIPSSDKSELIGNAKLPCATTINGYSARIDECGRLWSPHLKERFPVGTKITILRTDDGFSVFPEGAKESSVFLRMEQKDKAVFVGSDQGEHVKASTLEPYFRYGSLSILNEDILNTKAIENCSIDLIVTSPPYGVDIKYESYDDSIPYSQYLEFTRGWLRRCYEFAKDDGRLCLNVPLDKNKGGQQSVYADIATIAKGLGWKYHSTIIWNEQNISRRTAWGSWLSASAPFVIAPVEVIVIMYKKVWRKMQKGKSDITRSEFLEWTNGVWNFSGESRNRIGHPAPFPVELPKRCIKLFSFIEDTVLDPFLGSGTTLIACLETNRVGIGVEINRNYCDLAIKRLKKNGICQKKLERF